MDGMICLLAYANLRELLYHMLCALSTCAYNFFGCHGQHKAKIYMSAEIVLFGPVCYTKANLVSFGPQQRAGRYCA